MTETRCSYGSDRAQTLMSYLYDDITPVERTEFESHLASCARCREELEELRGVREQLGAWSPPQPGFQFNAPPTQGRGVRSWREIPAWAQVAAAILVLGVAAGIAHLNVHYGTDGLTIRTGWSDAAARDSELKPRAANDAATAPWRSDLTALEQQLRGEMRSLVSARTANFVAPLSAATAAKDDEIMRRVRDLIAASERRQGRELALSVANVVRDVNASRAGDLARIEHTLGALQTSTGAELMKQRQQMVNYLTQVSLRR